MSSAPACQRATPRGKSVMDVVDQRTGRCGGRGPPARPGRWRARPPAGWRRGRPPGRGSSADRRAPCARTPAASLHSRRRSKRSFAEVRPEQAPVGVGRIGREGNGGLRQLHRARAVLSRGADPRAPEQRQAHRLQVGDGQRLAQLGELVPRGRRGLRVRARSASLQALEGGEDGVVALGGDEQRRRRRAVPRRGGGRRPRQVPAQRGRRRWRAPCGAPAAGGGPGEARGPVRPRSRRPRGARPAGAAARGGS